MLREVLKQQPVNDKNKAKNQKTNKPIDILVEGFIYDDNCLKVKYFPT